MYGFSISDHRLCRDVVKFRQGRTYLFERRPRITALEVPDAVTQRYLTGVRPHATPHNSKVLLNIAHDVAVYAQNGKTGAEPLSLLEAREKME